MAFDNIQLWEIILDAVGLFFCMITAVYLILCRFTTPADSFMNPFAYQGRELFNKKFADKLVQKYMGEFFELVIGSAGNWIQDLKNCKEKQSVSSAPGSLFIDALMQDLADEDKMNEKKVDTGKGLSIVDTDLSLDNKRINSEEDDGENRRLIVQDNSDSYEGVKKLAHLGMNSQMISEKLKVPICEVELVSKMMSF